MASTSNDERVEDFPGGIVVVRRWVYRAVDCAIGSVDGFLYGLARVAESRSAPNTAPTYASGALSPANLGPWLAFDIPPLSRYWSSEVLSRLATAGSSDLVAWDVYGYEWGIEKLRSEVNGFVDTALSSIPEPRRAHRNGRRRR
ncbi:hypothetical protein FHX42_001968 [Saccharopolyspora lacisalsi]|uniref:Uncharacterized protein n=1 Tax=Halosaccharopolyspora lacisalsi TaxID=1000566 RepID=A0A839DZH5_9PSEU|nr:hypothetical protein [Halosaccharopolyspora lacisalsi]MBA8824621.1 hypothetical protein [Halosaccharopolyspora lacisalsi]